MNKKITTITIIAIFAIVLCAVLLIFNNRNITNTHKQDIETNRQLETTTASERYDVG